MNSPARWPSRFPHRNDQGLALVIVLILLVVMSLTAATAMRGAITHERVVNNLRHEYSAQNHAEIALRFCEDQLLQSPANRISAFQGADSQPIVQLANLRWRDYPTWVSARAGAPSGVAFHSLGTGLVGGAPSPECMVERVALSGGLSQAWVVTARGFSRDYREDPGSGRTLSGSVVWLQSFLYVD